VTTQQALDAAGRREQQVADIVRLTQARVAVYLSRLDAARLVESWLAEVLPGVHQAVVDGQQQAVGGAQDYVAVAAAAMGLDGARAGRLEAGAFAGAAADGRPLATMLTVPVLRGRLAVEQRAQSAQWAVGQVRQSVALMTASEVEDAGRAANGVGMAATRSVTGYIRVVRAGACARCAVLAGKWFRYDAEFQRHPRCKCTQVPAGSRAASRLHGWQTDPRAYFDSLSAADQERLFGVAGARAIRAGADVAQVVNARRGLQAVPIGDRTILATTEGVSRRGWYGGLRRRLEQIEGRSLGRMRLTPEAIYQLAEDRNEVLRLLGRNGYLNLTTAEVAAL
jgi:hypothetical protein